MTETCRLCLSMTRVNNCIFGDDNKIYLKIVSCLPVKVTKEDTLPKKICDVCSCKIDDFYQFCHTTLEAENRLLDPSKPDVETNSSFGLSNDILIYKKTEPFKFSSNFSHINGYHSRNDTFDSQGEHLYNSIQNKLKQLNNSITEGTQTDEPIKLLPASDIKKEHCSLSPFGSEHCNENNDDSYFYSSEQLPSNELLKISIPNNEQDSFFFDKTKKKTKRIKKPKKFKEIKIKIKKNKAKFSVQTNYLSDSDDEVSLKKLKSKQSKIPLSKLEVLDNIKDGNILDEKDIKREDLGPVTFLDTVKVEFDPEKEEWNCCVCFMRYNSKNSMLAHYRTHYTNPVSFHASLLKVQSLEEDGNESKTSTCPVCQKIYTSKATFTKHLKKHGNDKPYKCSLCEKTFKNPLEILKHGKKSHTYEDELDYGDDEKKLDQRGPRPTTKRFICDMCDETFVYMKYLMVHRNAAHKEAEGRHLINRCLHCRREFTHLNSLRRHLRSHSGERNFLCYVCGKALTSREHLKFHIRIHTGFKPNICKTCGKGFVKKCNLTLHERVHSGEKPHVCSHCGKAFSQRSTLVIHERYHSGLRPYICTLCQKGFVAKGLLSVHMKTSCI